VNGSIELISLRYQQEHSLSSKLGWRLLLLLSLAHKVIAEMKNAPEGAFLHAFLAEWTGIAVKFKMLPYATVCLVLIQ
jgi:hypothetical protein